MTDDIKRCKWVNLNSELYKSYHDGEWGVPVYDDIRLFMDLSLEILSSGLSFLCVLNKRDKLIEAFDGFNPKVVSKYDEYKIKKLMNNKDIIRSKGKIIAIINNAKIFLEISNKFNGFINYLNSYTNGNIIYECGKKENDLSKAISNDLKGMGMKWIGSVTIYSYLQAIGVIYSHDENCHLYKKGV